MLAAANALIANNAGRLGKNLWTDGVSEASHRASTPPSTSRTRRASWSERIAGMDRSRASARAIAPCSYRSNAQSRALEQEFVSRGMPYRVYGGQRFFERAEIKDALAYLRLVANRDDDVSFERVVNQPARGIGERTLAQLRDAARASGGSLWRAARQAIDERLMSARAAGAVEKFLQLVDRLAAEVEGLELPEQVEHVVHRSGLIEHFGRDRSEKGEARVENLEELVTAARGTSSGRPTRRSEHATPLEAFLAHAALEAGEGQGEAWEDCVQLMTLHSAKGLEFPLVFLVGLEEGLFPHQRSLEESGRLEEERRLAYVGITRAQQRVFITCAEQRRLYGQETVRACPRASSASCRPNCSRTSAPRVQSRPVAARRAGALAGTAAERTVYRRMGQRVRHRNSARAWCSSFEGSGAARPRAGQLRRCRQQVAGARLRPSDDRLTRTVSKERRERKEDETPRRHRQDQKEHRGLGRAKRLRNRARRCSPVFRQGISQSAQSARRVPVRGKDKPPKTPKPRN
ncbi:MAG: 3'-5' exonuclease [Halofilum sp. (in: g-proteobacteria)]|nr:3'-5' exonuclease [Halofilum sp. (in: g-proteobacteria)]